MLGETRKKEQGLSLAYDATGEARRLVEDV